MDEGKFLKPFESLSTYVNCLDMVPHLNVVLSGGENGMCEIWDYRMRSRAADLTSN